MYIHRRVGLCMKFTKMVSAAVRANTRYVYQPINNLPASSTSPLVHFHFLKILRSCHTAYLLLYQSGIPRHSGEH